MLFAFGSNGSGQLCLGHQEDVNEPTACQAGRNAANDYDKPSAICAGGNHTLVLYASGDLYVVGAVRSHFSFAVSDNEAVQPRLLANGVSLCAATWEASVFSTQEGTQLFTCGHGAKGELGQGEGVLSIDTTRASPIDIPGLGHDGLRIVDLASGMQHTVAVLSDGSVYGWGHGRKGQLGEPGATVWTPRKIEGLGLKVVRASCGREFTHLVGSPEEGRHVVLGSDKWSIKSHAPELVPNWLQVGTGWGSILILFRDGTIRSWGRDDHGQLAPKNLPKISKLAVGSEHSIAITTDRSIIAWGWGEHGNCGTKIDAAGDVKHGWAEIPLTCDETTGIVSCAAGCATSWVWT